MTIKHILMSIQNKKDNATQLTGHVSEEEINQAFSVHTCMRYRERERKKERSSEHTCVYVGWGGSELYIYIYTRSLEKAIAKAGKYYMEC